MASMAAALTGAGTSKWGTPMLRLTGSLRLRARSKTRRMPETSTERMRWAIQWSCMLCPRLARAAQQSQFLRQRLHGVDAELDVLGQVYAEIGRAAVDVLPVDRAGEPL